MKSNPSGADFGNATSESPKPTLFFCFVFFAAGNGSNSGDILSAAKMSFRLKITRRLLEACSVQGAVSSQRCHRVMFKTSHSVNCATTEKENDTEITLMQQLPVSLCLPG